jgi:mannose-6-phosphate isomerase-like protein (cupin superfamily)
MNRIALTLMAAALIGFVAGHTTRWSQAAAAGQASGRGRGDAPPPITNTPPVPNPPLYPGDTVPNKPMYWPKAEILKDYETRLASFKARGDRGASSFSGQRFHTHSVGMNFRITYPTPRASNGSGKMSRYDDVEQHEGVSDFYVIAGGGGQMVVDGVIADREYRRAAGGNSGTSSILLPGEWYGQPIEGGHTYDVKPGDWLAIPPNAPHWQLPDPVNAVGYLLLKINVGLYPGSISR